MKTASVEELWVVLSEYLHAIDWAKIKCIILSAKKGEAGTVSHKRNSKKRMVNMGCTRIRETSALNPGGFHVIANLVRARLRKQRAILEGKEES